MEERKTSKIKKFFYTILPDFPDGSPANAENAGFDPWVGKIFCRKDWQSAPVFLLGKFNAQRSLVVYGVTKSQTQLSQGNRYTFQQTVKWQTPLEVECTVVWGSEVRQAGFHWALCHF